MLETTRKQAVQGIINSHSKYISDNPELLSYLFDVDLLPEQVLQTESYINALRMNLICNLYKLLEGKDNQ